MLQLRLKVVKHDVATFLFQECLECLG